MLLLLIEAEVDVELETCEPYLAFIITSKFLAALVEIY